nr:hypothetical protein [uncultured Oscillibacter sp.]
MAKAIAIKIDESLFREIHVKAAQKGFSTQQYVTELIKKNLFPARFPKMSERQVEQIRQVAHTLKVSLTQL